MEVYVPSSDQWLPLPWQLPHDFGSLSSCILGNEWLVILGYTRDASDEGHIYMLYIGNKTMATIVTPNDWLYYAPLSVRRRGCHIAPIIV